MVIKWNLNRSRIEYSERAVTQNDTWSRKRNESDRARTKEFYLFKFCSDFSLFVSIYVPIVSHRRRRDNLCDGEERGEGMESGAANA